MRSMTIAGVLAMLVAQAQAESRTYRLDVIPEKSLSNCSRAGQAYTVELSNGVLTLGTSYARRLFSAPVESDGKMATSFTDPASGLMRFIALGNGEYELISPLLPCHYRLASTG
ncbi:MAG: hypothetical protein U1E23_00810 [Reyranellaceae bacterium]